ncbi:phosphopyruvate hydratase [Candidatus Falkowbacteria bacterium RIFOXYB2_FULL_34_18]|uniref:Enolase n=1 Tax=Candidatus Falkowbacteria bacterium RIFOXYD2_FULL_34_120 TaxID=1798007 RepID=A0A1F5TSU2_9BACT|nr:MAG: phosphopyruvate hydratase [Candidatus Falkowbacteria bacterium RIFOXYB2_FULL_34_18]OGF30198.1 MAG: phosphopyruvate hydratase [Candidatus Falkowbacteria bacterium RIFOXYC12_FULL_34_55]OGF37653.1 MAG: phosphopyruvate hydratase [Candidatus Falkowbacteria bacterium RIFOXYC2_FULL_34_220]OGF39380.1 MAG: phosphopyruvate hydratase [Candidatus Falkowbacteria bacterium RIFOXYD12_FULL_34_57]OGF41909.1 MAG: phosphopyruvate hydratase [Candidatus Falkowbacteria bacterium RIFOXYD2_FULL_34_120]
MSKIKQIKAREILDSRGNPTIETKIILTNGVITKASVPSGASTGMHEAWELRDGDKKRYNGKGVLRAVENVNTKIFEKLKGVSVANQEKIDKEMIKLDGTKNKKKLGANAILSVSLACARAAAINQNEELYAYIANIYKFKKPNKIPTPSFNIFNGGKHADTNLDFQEFMILPLKDIKFSEKVRMGSEIFHELGHVLREAGFDTDVGNEGGYAPNIYSSIQAVELIIAAIVNAGYKPGEDIGLGTDVGSSELYNKETKKYIFKLDKAVFSSHTLIDLYYEWFRKFPIISIEDGLSEDDWDGWRELNKELGSEMLLIGDDLFVTNLDRLRIGLKEKAANAILIKPNQVGTLTETVECIKLAQKHNYKVMASHRSGETCDDFIADLSVAVGADYIKAGSLSRGERLAKYNRLMEIEEEIIK